MVALKPLMALYPCMALAAKNLISADSVNSKEEERLVNR
jgi:hypothetical protein